MENLKKQIEQLETMILIYSDRDRVRVSALEQRLRVCNMMLLDLMVQGSK